MVIRNYLTPLFLYKARKKGHPSRKGETRFFIRCGDRVPDILLHSLADASGKGIAGPDEGFGGYLSALMDRYARSFEPIRKTPPLITGHDLMHIFGLSPGPIFRTLLSQVRERQLSGDIATRDAAINWISRQCNDLGAPLTVTSPDGSN